MNRQEKKELERDFARAFLRTIGPSLESELNDFEKPDFILHTSELVGIEVTQLFVESNNGEISGIAIEGGRDDVLELALKKWTSSSNPSVDVRIMFNDSMHITKMNKDFIADEIVRLIDDHLPEAGGSFWSEDELVILPNGIVEFHIHRYSEIEASTMRFNDAAWTPQLTKRNIQKTITKKEKRREFYLQHCDKIWLLLVLYGRRPSGSFVIPENLVKENYEFKFDKVYLFNAFPANVWELQRIEIRS